jgi:hypothetical protein
MANNIPTTIKSWFKTLSSNQPDGSDLFASLVDDLRAIQTAVRAWFEDAEWRDYGHTPTRIAANQFTVTGNQTAVYVVGRAVKCTDGANTFYGIITGSAFSSVTTVTVTLDSGALTASLSAVALGIDNSNGALRTASTAAVDTSTTQLATTAFVINQGSNANPLMNGSVAQGTSKRYSRQDHVHPADTSKALVNNAFVSYADDSPIVPNVPGSPHGKAFFGSAAGHVVIVIQGNDSNDGFHVIGTESLGEYDTSLLQVTFNGIKYKNNTIWHAGNDGAGSGLDADLLGGYPGSYYLSGASGATQSEMEAATRNDLLVTPANAHWHPAAAKAWGKVTVSSGVPTLAVSFGVSSIIDTNVGILQVNFATVFSSAHYSAVVSFNGDQLIRVNSQAAHAMVLGSRVITALPSTYDYDDPDFWCFAAFGDQ